MTVVSVIVSGFICYHRQLAKVAEESAPEPTANGRNGGTLPPNVPPVPMPHGSAPSQQVQTSFMLKEWNFNTWFRNNQKHGHPPVYRQ